MAPSTDPVLAAIAGFLKKKHGCHSAILYGSRARGRGVTSTSDYDVVGICKAGAKTRFAKRVRGAYWDLFVYPEKELKKLGSEQDGWRDAQVLFERGRYGRELVGRLQKHLNQPFVPAPGYQIAVTRAWAHKQLDRIASGDLHGLYRRAELQAAAIGDYFQIRRKRFLGPKTAFAWLESHDPKAHALFSTCLQRPGDAAALSALVSYVYKVKC